MKNSSATEDQKVVMNVNLLYLNMQIGAKVYVSDTWETLIRRVSFRTFLLLFQRPNLLFWGYVAAQDM